MPKYINQAPLTFAPASGFLTGLNARAAAWFEGRPRRANAAMVTKTLILLVWLAMSWTWLVFGADSLSGGLFGALSMGAACAGLGLNVPHDANHNAYARSRLANDLIAAAMDALLGSSCVMWRLRHNIMHHVRPNISGQDDTISYGSILRVKPGQPLLPAHRFQHIYVWPLYGIVLLKWFLLDDFKWFRSRRMATYTLEFTDRDRWQFVLCKAIWLGFMIGVPMLFQPWWAVLGAFVLVMALFSLILVVITQVAHVNDAIAFPDPDPETGQMSDEWVVHQLRTTADFGHGNPLLNWYAGGLNYQVIHHLFPAVCHVHHKPLTQLLKDEIAASGRADLPYLYYPGLFAAMRAHHRFLRRMGRPGA